MRIRFLARLKRFDLAGGLDGVSAPITFRRGPQRTVMYLLNWSRYTGNGPAWNTILAIWLNNVTGFAFLERGSPKGEFGRTPPPTLSCYGTDEA